MRSRLTEILDQQFGKPDQCPDAQLAIRMGQLDEDIFERGAAPRQLPYPPMITDREAHHLFCWIRIRFEAEVEDADIAVHFLRDILHTWQREKGVASSIAVNLRL